MSDVIFSQIFFTARRTDSLYASASLDFNELEVVSAIRMAFRAVGFFTVVDPILACAVSHIVYLSSWYQVARKEAGRVIASMSDNGIAKYWYAVKQQCGYPMNTSGFLAYSDHPIPIGVLCFSPQPAAGLKIYDYVVSRWRKHDAIHCDSSSLGCQ